MLFHPTRFRSVPEMRFVPHFVLGMRWLRDEIYTSFFDYPLLYKSLPEILAWSMDWLVVSLVPFADICYACASGRTDVRSRWLIEARSEMAELTVMVKIIRTAVLIFAGSLQQAAKSVMLYADLIYSRSVVRLTWLSLASQIISGHALAWMRRPF